MALTGVHEVGGMRFPVGDDPVGAVGRYLRRETVEKGEQLCHIRSAWGKQLPGRFGKRAARPPLIKLSKRCFELAAAGQFEIDSASAGWWRCSMELGEHREDRGALGRVVLAKPA